ncbi:MAG: sugar ABC transporter substrate-binding protein [Lachnospiraceae bacterium]|nr:sugar ABC transporter substrate-binding protein [Lachnospiraceae bacterium]
MKKKIILKKILASVMAFGLICGSLAGCGSGTAQDGEGSAEQETASEQETSDEKSFKIAVGLPDSGSTMFSLMSNNVKTMVENMGGTAVFQGGVGASADATIQFVEDQIAAGADGIVLSPPSDSVLTTVTTMCEEAGVYWGIAFRTIKDEEVKALVESSDYYIGHCFEDEEKTGYQVMSNLHNKGISKVAIISLAKGNNTTDLREQGAQRACEEFGMEIVAEARDLTQASDATNAAESFLSAYSDLDAIFVVGTTGAGIHEAVAKAIEDAGKVESVKLATIDFPDSMAELFEKDILATSSGAPSWGYDPYMITVALANTCKGNRISDTPLELEVLMYDIDNVDTAAKWLEKYGNADTLYYEESVIKDTLDKSANSSLDEEAMRNMIQEFVENTAN